MPYFPANYGTQYDHNLILVCRHRMFDSWYALLVMMVLWSQCRFVNMCLIHIENLQNVIASSWWWWWWLIWMLLLLLLFAAVVFAVIRYIVLLYVYICTCCVLFYIVRYFPHYNTPTHLVSKIQEHTSFSIFTTLQRLTCKHFQIYNQMENVLVTPCLLSPLASWTSNQSARCCASNRKYNTWFQNTNNHFQIENAVFVYGKQYNQPKV